MNIATAHAGEKGNDFYMTDAGRLHGSPGKLTLNELKNGEMGVIQAICLSGPTKRRLIEMGITPGTDVRISKRAPLGDPIELRLRGYSLTLRADDARHINVVRREVSK